MPQPGARVGERHLAPLPAIVSIKQHENASKQTLNATYRSHCLDSFVSEPVEFDAGKCTNTYLVPREYVDEAERGRIADTIL